MANRDRRAFLKSSAAALSGVALGRCAPGEGRGGRRPGLEPGLLRALGGAVLPAGELGAEGVERVVAGFERWLEGFEPVAELNHGYGTAEIEYGLPDPAPRWRAQLEALELEARRRHGRGFADLGPGERRELVRRRVRDDPLSGLPPAAEARHVAAGLLAYFYATPEATDLCYGAEIRPRTCRELRTVHEVPEPLSETPRSGA